MKTSRINHIMNHASMTHWKGCGQSYVAFSEQAEEICPMCKHDHYQDIRELMTNTDNVDDYDADSLGLTGFFDPVEVV